MNKELRIYYGWLIVGVSFLCWFAADAFGWYTFGIFIEPISKDLGWTTAMVTGAFTIRSIIAGLSGPVVGPLVDKRYGARSLMTIGVLMAGAVPLAVSRMNSLWQFYLFYGFIGALSMVGFGGLVTNSLIAKWFIRKRGRAMGIATMGVSIAGMVFVPTVHFFISYYGWRGTLGILGFIIWGIALLPVFLVVRRRPEDIGLLPDGNDGISSRKHRIMEQKHDILDDEEIWTLREALRTRCLWMLLAGFSVTGFALNGSFLHFYPYLLWKGFSPDLAATAITIFAFFCAIVKIPWGLFAERFHVRHCITVCYIGCTISMLILIDLRSTYLLLLCAIIYGVIMGGDMILKELVWANYFGRTFLGTIRGIVMPVNLISMAGGPLFVAGLRDHMGSYQLPYYVFLFTSIAGTIIIFLAKPPEKAVNRTETTHCSRKPSWFQL